MLEPLTDLPAGIEALRAAGTVTARDYRRGFAPIVGQAQRTDRRMRLLYQFGPEFCRLTPGALWADTRLGFSYLRLLEGCAVVSDTDWIREPTQRIAAWMPCPVRVFSNGQRDEAIAWLRSLPERTGVSRRELALAYLGGLGAELACVASLAGTEAARRFAR